MFISRTCEWDGISWAYFLRIVDSRCLTMAFINCALIMMVKSCKISHFAELFNRVPTIHVWRKIKETITDYQVKNVIPKTMKANIILHRNVFLMTSRIKKKLVLLLLLFSVSVSVLFCFVLFYYKMLSCRYI